MICVLSIPGLSIMQLCGLAPHQQTAEMVSQLVQFVSCLHISTGASASVYCVYTFVPMRAEALPYLVNVVSQSMRKSLQQPVIFNCSTPCRLRSAAWCWRQ